MNALAADAYYTVHVTPQQQCSYASFETNFYAKDYTPLITRILSLFHPQRFFIMLLANASAGFDSVDSGFDCTQFAPFGFIRDRIFYQFEHYNLTFLDCSELSPLSHRRYASRHETADRGIEREPAYPSSLSSSSCATVGAAAATSSWFVPKQNALCQCERLIIRNTRYFVHTFFSRWLLIYNKMYETWWYSRELTEAQVMAHSGCAWQSEVSSVSPQHVFCVTITLLLPWLIMMVTLRRTVCCPCYLCKWWFQAAWTRRLQHMNVKLDWHGFITCVRDLELNTVSVIVIYANDDFKLPELDVCNMSM